MEERVPLVVPEVNGAAVEKHAGIISCPNCTTIPLVMCLEPIRRAVGLRAVVVTTLQAVSGAGKPGLDELERQVDEIGRGESATCDTFAAPIAYNAVPLCESFRDDGYSTEEMKLRDESRKILSLPGLDVTMTCVRVPVRVGHSASVLIETERPLAPESARELLAAFPGITVVDDPARNRPRRRARTTSSSAASGRISRATASGSGRCPTTSARERRPTRFRSPRS
jgi:aspartate-semialdehyde dehydrogenase